MPGKAKFQKHTAKELEQKANAAKYAAGAAGGGGKMADARKNHVAKVAVLCKVCKSAQPNLVSMTQHYESKHAKEDFNAVKEEYETQFVANRAAAKE